MDCLTENKKNGYIYNCVSIIIIIKTLHSLTCYNIISSIQGSKTIIADPSPKH